jgi:uncharacterized DUF497 family protein
MPKVDFRQEVVNVALAELLEQRGLSEGRYVANMVDGKGTSHPARIAGDVRTNVLTRVRKDHMLSWWRPGYAFETAMLVFDDPYALTQRDFASEDEERWITIGAIGPGSILLVVHTFYEEQGEEIIRIISARAAESHERRAYEEAHKGAEARHPRHRRKKRPRH